MNFTFKITIALMLMVPCSHNTFAMAPANILEELDNNLALQIEDLAVLRGDNTIYTTLLLHDRHLMVKRYIEPFSKQLPVYKGSIEVNRSWPNVASYNLPTEKCVQYFKILAAEHERRN